MRPAGRRFVPILGVALGTLLGYAPADGADPVLKLRAFAVNMSNVGRARSGTIDITVERWTTDEERQSLKGVLIEKGGGDALISALQKIKPRAGFVNAPGTLGWDLHFAHEVALPDGARRIILATDRPMSFWEAANNPRSADYEFLLLEIRLDKDGKGQGKMAAAAKIEYNEVSHTVEIENYASEPVRLTKVEVVGQKKG
jgi:hypothetical protein